MIKKKAIKRLCKYVRAVCTNLWQLLSLSTNVVHSKDSRLLFTLILYTNINITMEKTLIAMVNCERTIIKHWIDLKWTVLPEWFIHISWKIHRPNKWSILVWSSHSITTTPSTNYVKAPTMLEIRIQQTAYNNVTIHMSFYWLSSSKKRRKICFVPDSHMFTMSYNLHMIRRSSHSCVYALQRCMRFLHFLYL